MRIRERIGVLAVIIVGIAVIAIPYAIAYYDYVLNGYIEASADASPVLRYYDGTQVFSHIDVPGDEVYTESTHSVSVTCNNSACFPLLIKVEIGQRAYVEPGNLTREVQEYSYYSVNKPCFSEAYTMHLTINPDSVPPDWRYKIIFVHAWTRVKVWACNGQYFIGEEYDEDTADTGLYIR